MYDNKLCNAVIKNNYKKYLLKIFCKRSHYCMSLANNIFKLYGSKKESEEEGSKKEVSSKEEEAIIVSHVCIKTPSYQGFLFFYIQYFFIILCLIISTFFCYNDQTYEYIDQNLWRWKSGICQIIK